jgi:hypothetical protein
MKMLAAAAFAAATLGATAADARQYDFSFVGYYSGLRIAEANGSLDWGGGRYRLDIQARADGIVDWFTVIDHRTQSEGAIADKPLVERHYSLSQRGRKRTEMELAFSPDDIEIVTASPHPSTEERPPVPQSLRQGALDPLSAVLAIGVSTSEAKDCNSTEPVFDGRRRYDIVLENSRAVQYEGPAGARETYVCDFRFIRKGGYSEEAKKWKGIVGTVWLQRFEDGMPMLPVRMEIQTKYGIGYIHMVSANKTS